MVIQIAKAELRNLFYSPVAWFLAIAFMVLFASVYTTNVYLLVRFQEITLERNPSFKDAGPIPLTYSLFVPPNGILRVVLEQLYLFVPLLTMGLIGREMQTGTIKLLYSSPVKLRSLVAGKFAAIMVYNLLLVGIAGIMMLSFAFSVRSVDYGIFFSSALALFLMTCAYTAIGLFVSSLTSYQVIAAVGTFLIVFLLSNIGGLWQKYDFLRDITYALHLRGRTLLMLKGLITSRDVIYYIAVMFLFLGFTLIRLKNFRESKPWYIQMVRVMGVIAITLTLAYFSSLPQINFYVDTTAQQVNTIHPNTRKVVKELKDSPLEVTLYVNLLGGSANFGFPEARNEYISYVWEKMQRFKPDIRFNYIYYYYYREDMDGGGLKNMFPGKNNEEMAREVAKGFKIDFNKFIPPQEIKKIINLEPEGHRLIMQLKYKGRTEFLRTYNASTLEGVWPTEENMAAAMKRLAHPESIPKILYTSDNLERSINRDGEREYYFSVSKRRSSSPVNLGFDIDTISLEKQDIPADITTLVVADPKSAFSSKVYEKIEKYIDDGGNIVFMGEPGKQQMLNQLIKKFGVEMMEGTLVEPTYDEMPQMVKPYYTRISPSIADENFLWVINERWVRHIKDTTTLLMPGVAALSYSDSIEVGKKSLLVTNGNRTWLKKGKLIIDSANVEYNAQDGDIKGAFPTVLQLTRQMGNKQQRAVIFGDADFMCNLRLQDGEMINRAVLSWISGNEYPVYLRFGIPKDNLMTITLGTAKLMRIIFLWVMPSLLLIMGAIILLRRKRK